MSISDGETTVTNRLAPLDSNRCYDRSHKISSLAHGGTNEEEISGSVREQIEENIRSYRLDSKDTPEYARFDNILGSGSYGTVYGAKFKGMDVVVKCIVGIEMHKKLSYLRY
mmetsp:Transcript_2631/g.5017  ORF Transcript_2631/g.5017 Transcript_2631/m.5017 type:complete len:112 (+) Transcript_2631:84-419(+)